MVFKTVHPNSSVELEELIYKYALKNAVEHGGRADEGAVIGKVVAEAPEVRKHIKNILPLVRDIVSRVNSMSIEEQKKELSRFHFEEPKKEEKEDLPPLEGKLPPVLRFAPEPGGFIHIGNLRAAIVNHLYAEKYKGTFILRYDDTNPRNVKLVYYDAIKEDLEALGIKIHRIVYQSDRIDVYLEYLKKLLEDGHAYASFEQNISEKRKDGVPFEGRDRAPEENLEIMDKILEGEYREGEVAFFLKTDPSHPNPVLRDPGIFRIVDAPHPRTGWKYRLYPTYNFASAIDDGTLGVTHVFRGKDHENNGKVQRTIQEILSLEIPYTVAFGRLNVDEGEFLVGLSKRRIRQALKDGIIDGWDHPGLLTVRSLLERGILPQSFMEFYRLIGIKKTDILLKMDNIYSINRKFLDKKARRVFFLEEPYEIVLDAPEREVSIPWHPDIDMGNRVYKVNKRIFIDKKDVKERVRLKYLFNIEIEKNRGRYIGDDPSLTPRIHWIPDIEPIEGTVLFPSGKRVDGLLEFWAQTLKEGEIVQLDRLYFVRVKRNNGEKVLMYYTHK